MGPGLWSYSRSFSDSTGRNALMPLTPWSTLISTLILSQPDLAICPSWRRVTSTTVASFTIERLLCLLPLRAALSGAVLNRELVDRTQGSTMRPTVDATASTVVDTLRHLRGMAQHLARDCQPGPEDLMASRRAHHLQSTITVTEKHTWMALRIGIVNVTGNETETVTGHHEVGLSLGQGTTSTHISRRTNANV